MALVNAVNQKGRFSKNKINTPGIHLIYNCTKFQHDWVILNSLGKTGPKGPKKGDFQKIYIPGYSSIYKCVKFQQWLGHFWLLLVFSKF